MNQVTQGNAANAEEIGDGGGGTVGAGGVAPGGGAYLGVDRDRRGGIHRRRDAGVGVARGARTPQEARVAG